MKNLRTRKLKRGFTLIEILVVVTIIGLLAALAVPTFLKVTKNSRAAALARDLKTIVNASETYIMESGLWPPDTNTGAFPFELAGYFSQRFFETNTPAGGNWDFEQYDSGITSAVGVVSPDLEETIILQQVDAVIDDSNLNTGRFRKLGANQYYWIIAD